jgi:hypothetical protein
MLERFDHRPMLTAALALSTTMLILVVVTLSTLLITSAPPVATSSSVSDGGNPGAVAASADRMDAGSYGEVYGWNIQAGSSDASNDADVDSHAEVVPLYGR